ncbi:MAG: hypothetical protein WC877_06735 [Dehalococcoidales bacterium]|jgi:hypothetical protein
MSLALQMTSLVAVGIIGSAIGASIAAPVGYWLGRHVTIQPVSPEIKEALNRTL